MIIDAGWLDSQISEVAPIDGIRIGVPDDKSTWEVWFKAEATQEQRAAAQAVIQAFDPLVPLRRNYRARIDDDAERCRQKYITPGAGMAMTYMEKHAQARAVMDMGEAAANALDAALAKANFPTLAASVGREAPTLYDCAQIVIAAYERFAYLSNVIEACRLDARAAVAAATTEAGVVAAYEAVTWP